MARLIIGKEDKPSRADDVAGSQSQLRFVRIPGQDQVYRVQFKADKFSTNFADWIETDLLKLNPWDITDIKLRDYSVVEAVTRDGELAKMLNPRADIDLTFDDKGNKWNLKDFVQYKGKQKTEAKLTDDQELNATKLNDLKTALAGLKIIDVSRKPAQMSANLKAGKEYLDAAASQDLQRRGFTPVPAENNQFDIVSNDGEAVVSMKDGRQYVLRFGDVAGIDSGADADKKKSAEGGKADGKANSKDTKSAADKPAETAVADGEDSSSGPKADKSGGLSRYIMVMAKFNPDLIPKPDLQPLPEIKKAPEKGTAGKVETSKSDSAKSAAADKKGDAKAEAKKDANSDDSKAGSTAATNNESDDQERSRRSATKLKRKQCKQDEYDDKIKKGEQARRNSTLDSPIGTTW